MSSLTRPLNSWDIAKLVGLALMFIDHSGHFFFTDEQWLRAVGRGAMPVFLFLAGFAASYRFSRELLVLAVAMTACDILVTGRPHAQNILFTIILVRMALHWMEKTGRTVNRPFEWFMVAAAWSPTALLVQYGTIGFLFALCGYMKRHRARYKDSTRRLFLAASFAFALLIQAAAGEYTASTVALAALVMAATGIYLERLEVKPVDTSRWPAGAAAVLKYAARYSAYIYALHLMALEWMTGIAF